MARSYCVYAVLMLAKTVLLVRDVGADGMVQQSDKDVDNSQSSTITLIKSHGYAFFLDCLLLVLKYLKVFFL